MDFDYWNERLERPRTSFTVYATDYQQQRGGGGVLLDDQEELDSIRSLINTSRQEDEDREEEEEQFSKYQPRGIEGRRSKLVRVTHHRMSGPSGTGASSGHFSPYAAPSTPYQIRNLSPDPRSPSSPYSSSPSSVLQQQQCSSGESVCAVCGDGHAKLHYGVLACYGCKGFFRRTLTGKYRYVCRFGNHCIVDKFQRNSCRCCRFQRCLDVGMDPKAVRPDRDLTGKQKVPRVRKRAMDEELINHMMRLQGDDWSRKIPVESKVLLMQLLNIESKVAKGDSSTLGDPSTTQVQPEVPVALSTSTRSVSLKDLFEQKPSSTRRTEMCYEPYRMARAEELPKIAHRGAIAAVDWVESLDALIDSIALDTNDKISLVKACYAPLTIFNFSARTVQNTRNADILCLCSYSYVPRKLPADFNGSNHLSNHLIDRTLNELVAPLRKLTLREEEVVALKAIIILDPNAKNLSAEAQHGVVELRNRVQDMLFQVVKELHPTQNAVSRFGNLLLLLPTITTLSSLMCENMQFCQVFGWTDPLLNELFEPSESEKAAGNDQFAFFGDAIGPSISYSPPMLGSESSQCNPADISLHPNEQQQLCSPSSSLPGHVTSSRLSTTSSTASSSSASPNASTTSASPSPSKPHVEKCEMSTQTELQQFDHSMLTALAPSYGFESAVPFGGHSPFPSFFDIPSQAEGPGGHEHQHHHTADSIEFSAADSLLFDNGGGSSADLFGLMQ